MSLAALQRAVARAVSQPLTREDRMRKRSLEGKSMRAIAERWIKPNDRLSSFGRLEIYNRQYWFRLLSSLIEDFPGLRAILGEKRFESMSRAYLVDCPSRSFTLRNLGSRLERWLVKNPGWIVPNRELAMDMVRLEWADIEAFDAPALPPLRQEDLADLTDPRIKLRLQPYLHLLALRFPVDDLLIQIKHGEELKPELASNAYHETRSRTSLHFKQCRPEPVFLGVHRMENSVYFRRIEREEFVLLRALGARRTLRQAIGAAFLKSGIVVADRPAAVETWFRNWSARGWFCGSSEHQKRNRS